MDHEIATECGISNRALYKWKKKEEFIARVNEMLLAYSARALGSGIASRVHRVETLNVLSGNSFRVSTRRTLLAIPPPNTRAEYAWTMLFTRAMNSSRFFHL